MVVVDFVKDFKMKSKNVDLKCICCGEKLKFIGHGDFDPSVDMWQKAGVHQFVPGFGSRYDSTEFVVGICDDCLTKKLEDGLIIKVV